MILSEDACIQKPHKGIFDFALKNTNSRRSESLMIGDSWEADIIGAYNSKIDQLWLNPEGLPTKGFTPTYIIGKTKSTASQNEKYKKCRLISVYVKLKRHSFLV